MREKGKMIMGKVLFLFITAVLLCGWGVNASVLSDNYVYKEIIIKENDTLWDIAAKETDNRMDIREYIYTVKRLNAIKNSGNLVPGQTIRLPMISK